MESAARPPPPPPPPLEGAGDSDQIARPQCPIGIPELHGRAPVVIAVSVAAQVLQVLQDDET